MLRHMRIWRSIDAVARAGSIRRAAENLGIAASAVQRRIADVEADLGAPIFERSPAGIRLTSAGEIFLGWVRQQDADLARTQSQIAALAGLRGGHVRLMCSQALAAGFMPDQIAQFQERHKQVSFDCQIADHQQAMARLLALETELVVVFRPALRAELQVLASLGQALVAIMAASHPLAARPTLRLRDCAAYPLALPGGAFGARQILDDRFAIASARPNIVFQSDSFESLRNFVRNTRAITFQIALGAPDAAQHPGYAVRPIDDRDATHGPLVLGQLQGRALPVAASAFAEQLARALHGLRYTSGTN